jgi:hypothetical protein
MSAQALCADLDPHTRAREIAALRAELDSLYADIQSVAAEGRGFINGVPPNYRESASNLMHYLALRCLCASIAHMTMRTYGLG